MKRAAAPVFLFGMLLAWTVALQYAGQAYSSEFSGYPDEPTHYVSGLLVRDYAAAGFPAGPMKFAERFYLHYPKVAIGMWGPLLHACQGVWMLLFSPSRVSVLLLMALVTAALAFSLSRVAGASFGRAAGLAAGLALPAVPWVQMYTSMIMADGLCALMDFWAALCFALFLKSERRRDAVLFGVFASLAILTKGNGNALALLPPLAILFTRRFALLKNVNLWLAALIVALLAGPWQYISERWLLSGVGLLPRHDSYIPRYAYLIMRTVGPWLLPVALLGFHDRVVRPFRSRCVEPLWASAAALIFAFWIFHLVVPSGGPEPRYVIAVAAPMILFVAAGAAKVAGWLPARIPLRTRSWAVAAAAVCLFSVSAFPIAPKASYGYVELGRTFASRPHTRDTVLLVSSEAGGEGMCIAEIAMRDRRPGYVVLRATKTLSRQHWQGNDYTPLFAGPAEIQKYLQAIPVSYLILDRNPGPRPRAHHRDLVRMVSENPGAWRLAETYPGAAPVSFSGSRIEVYQYTGPLPDRPGKIRLDTRYVLGRWIER